MVNCPHIKGLAIKTLQIPGLTFGAWALFVGAVPKKHGHTYNIDRVGQNRIYTPYMTVYLVISLPKIPYVERIYMVLANPKYIDMNENLAWP